MKIKDLRSAIANLDDDLDVNLFWEECGILKGHPISTIHLIKSKKKNKHKSLAISVTDYMLCKKNEVSQQL